MSITQRWRDHIEAWQGSGLKQADYCRQHAISYKTFAARLSEYRQLDGEKKPLRSCSGSILPKYARGLYGILIRRRVEFYLYPSPRKVVFTMNGIMLGLINQKNGLSRDTPESLATCGLQAEY